jgi:hypothetical protein
MISDYTTIPTMFKDVVLSNPDKKLFNYKKENQWLSLTGTEIYETVE